MIRRMKDRWWSSVFEQCWLEVDFWPLRCMTTFVDWLKTQLRILPELPPLGQEYLACTTTTVHHLPTNCLTEDSSFLQFTDSKLHLLT